MTENLQEFRACCGDAAAKLGNSAPMIRSDIEAFSPDDGALPIFEAPVEMPPGICEHEMSHCAIAIASGGTVDTVEAMAGKFIAKTSMPDEPWRHHIAMMLAGPIGQAWAGRLIHPMPVAELAWTLRAVRALGGGRCDACRAVRVTTVALRHPPDEVVMTELRRIERVAQEFVTAPRNWFWIERLAKILQARGKMTGSEIEVIFPKYEFDVSGLEQLTD